MPHQVKTLVQGLSLPDGNWYPINSVVTLTDEQYAMLSPAVFTSGDLQDLGGIVSPAPVALTYAATIATDASLSNHFRVVLTGNTTLGAPTNLIDGKSITWEIVQDGVGSRTVTLASIFNVGPLTLNWSTGANKVDYLGTIYRASANKLDVIAFSPGY